jgi:outer membrane protein assembly factor BamD
VLVGLGDSYEAEARFVRTMKLPEAGKARLEKIYDDQAIAAYSKVVLEHSASPHVEDARDRLDAMNVPIPTPTPEQVAASLALENSRRQYRLQDRARLLVLHQPDVVMAARDGEPTLADPTPTIAPHITTKILADFKDAMNPGAPAGGTPALSPKPAPTSADAGTAAAEGAAPGAASASPAAPLALSDVPAADAGAASGTSSTTNISGAAPTPPASSGNSIGGVEIITPGATASPAPDNGGLKAVGPTNSTPLPAAEKAAGAPDAVNDIAPGTQAAAQQGNANGKNGKPAFDKSEESDSKHKKKKGLNKLNPF